MALLGSWLGIAGSAVTVPRFLYALFAVRFNALARTRNYELWQPTSVSSFGLFVRWRSRVVASKIVTRSPIPIADLTHVAWLCSVHSTSP
ncbi:uncharacterized protein BDW70DRAFT_49488 [Aspergillus foveolatus]|uniref:uncharacterized protein n=1 Tax=Aspergillus foveolatus TaxID=210207 RepID=UPI003CCDA7E3